MNSMNKKLEEIESFKIKFAPFLQEVGESKQISDFLRKLKNGGST